MNARVLDILSFYDRNQEATLYIGNLDLEADEEILWELFMQAGRVKSIHVPRDKVTGQHQGTSRPSAGFGFVEFETEEDADYALRVLNYVKVYHKPLRLNKAAKDKEEKEVGPRHAQIGANLFVGNIDDEVDEKLLHSTFSAFGNVMLTKAASGKSYAFVSFDNFESSDAALAAMNGQYLCNKPIHVSYAYKKDTRGERHGSAIERLIAANRPPEFGAPGPHPHVPVPPVPMAGGFPPPPMPMHPLMNPGGVMMPPPMQPPGMFQPNMVPPPPPMMPQPNMQRPAGMPPLPVPPPIPVIPQNMPKPPAYKG